jgi:hypothetical protein
MKVSTLHSVLRAALSTLVVSLVAASCSPIGEQSEAQSAKLASGSTIRGVAGKCLDVDGGRPDDGTKVQLWDCNGTAAQGWSIDGGTIVATSGKCLDVKWGDSRSGAVVQLWTCNGTDAQRWNVQGDTIVGLAGKCLDVQWGSSKSGTPVQLWDCNGTAAQRWEVTGGGVAGGPAPPAPGPVVTDPGAPLPADDLAAAQAFVEPLTLGFNVERGWAWALPGQSSTTSTRYWSYLKNTAHATHVRLFYPWRPSITMGGGGANNSPPDEAAFDRILDAAAQAIAAGLKVFVDFTDVMGTEDFEGANGNATRAHLANAAKWSSERNLDKAMIAYGPVNEWAGGDDNVLYAGHRQAAQDTLRRELPGYVLTTGPAYWKSRDYLYDPAKKFEPFADLRVIYEWHHYSSIDAAGWESEERKLADWRARNGGRPTVCGEAGPGYWDEIVDGQRLAQNAAAWPSRFLGQLPAIAKERPSVWAITYGGEYRVNKPGDDPHVLDGSNGQPNLLAAFVQSETAMRRTLGR